MLVDFKFKNFRSFRDESSINMVASGYRRHPSHVEEIGDKQILKGLFLFGANAGGKSNLIKAASFVKHAVCNGLGETDCDGLFFRLNPKGPEEHGVFQFTIHADGRFYEYGLVVSYFTTSIVSEWLSILDENGKAKHVFSYDTTGQHPVIETDMSLNHESKARFDVYKSDAENSQFRKIPFLSEIAQKRSNEEATLFFRHFNIVYRWFVRLTIIFPETKYTGTTLYIKNPVQRTELALLLRDFDTGIESLDSKDVDVEKVLMSLSPDYQESTKASWIRALTSGDGTSAIDIVLANASYMVTFENGRLRLREIVANHGKNDDPFERQDESDGTQRLYDLLPLRQRFANDCVVMVDELDRSFHTKAVLKFIDMFYSAARGKKSQFIATVHDDDVLDLDLLRQDEIWFVERGEDHASRLYPLTKYRARFDKDIRKDYLLGRYGALPIFSTSDPETLVGD